MKNPQHQFQKLVEDIMPSSRAPHTFHVSYEAPPQRSPYNQGVTHTLAMVLIATLAVTALFG